MKTKQTTLLTALALFAGFGLTIPNAEAASYALGDIDDVRIQDTQPDGLGDSVQPIQLWAGPLNGDGWGVFFVYDLPTLGLDEKTISSADFSAAQDQAIGSSDLRISVFTRATQTVQAADYEGSGTDYTSGIETLETGFGGSVGTHTLTSGGQDALVSFLNENKDDQYLFVRITAVNIPTSAEANAASRFGDGASVDTTLSFTAVPEPSSAALLGLGGLAFALRRRR